MEHPTRTGGFLASPATLLGRHAELVRFAIVGAGTFVVDTAVFLLLENTVLEPKPVTAKILAVLVATIVGYLANREWSFRARGGLARPREAARYFVVSGIALIVSAAPLGVSRYVLHLAVPHISAFSEQVADLCSAQVVGTLLAMAFRWWAFRRWVFPTALAD